MDINNFKETYGFLTNNEKAQKVPDLLKYIDERAVLHAHELAIAVNALKHCSDNTNWCRAENAQEALEIILNKSLTP